MGDQAEKGFGRAGGGGRTGWRGVMAFQLPPGYEKGRATGGPSFAVDPARGNPHRGTLGEGASGAALASPAPRPSPARESRSRFPHSFTLGRSRPSRTPLTGHPAWRIGARAFRGCSPVPLLALRLGDASRVPRCFAEALPISLCGAQLKYR